MNNQPQQFNRYQWAIFIFCFLLIGWRAFTITTTNGTGRDNVYGDSYSDKNVMSAVRFFHEKGFAESYLLPVHMYDGPGDTSYGAYTHYPPLPDVLAGVYAVILDTTSEPLLRVFPMLLSMLWFFLIYKVLETLLKNKTQAFIGGSILVLSNYFIGWADNLHKHALEEMLKWLYVYCIYRYYNNETRHPKWLALMCLIFILAINVSFEPATFLAVLSIGFSLLYQRRLFTAVTILPGIAAVVGFGLHMWQNALYFGGWDKALEDMQAALLLRTTGEETAGHTVSEIGDKSFHIGNLAFEWFNRMERYYLIPGWAILVLAVWGMAKMYKQNRRLFFITLTLLIASMSWSFAMMHHAYVHMFTSRQWGIWIGLICAFTLPLYWQEVKSAFATKKYFWIVFHVLFIGYIVGMAVTQQIYGLYWLHGFGFNQL